MTPYKFVTREEIEKAQANALYDRADASEKLLDRLLAERDAYRQGWYTTVKSFLKYPSDAEVDATLWKDVDTEAARLKYPSDAEVDATLWKDVDTEAARLMEGSGATDGGKMSDFLMKLGLSLMFGGFTIFILGFVIKYVWCK